MELYGALLILMMIVRPQGIISLDTVQSIKNALRRLLGIKAAGGFSSGQTEGK
jgi:hypothetical protein